MEQLTLQPIACVAGEIHLPGSKACLIEHYY